MAPRTGFAALLSWALLSLLPARAQSPDPSPPPSDNAWSTVETVEVEARPGPAVWHVTRGQSEVWILGTVGAMPKGLDWNKQYLSDLLAGARAIVMPPRADFGLLEAGWFLLTHAGDLDMSLPRGQTLKALVPDAVWSRFLALAAAIGEDPARYAGDTPLGAARRLNRAVMEKAKLAGGEPRDTINSLARRKDVPEEPALRFEIIPIAEDVFNLSPAAQEPCFGEEIDDADRLLHHAAAAGQAWAVGDIKGVEANYAPSRLGDCMEGLVHQLGDVDQNQVQAYATAIDAALNKPGKTVVVIAMGPLLRKGGVLDQLEARHMTIEGPAE